MAILVQFLFRLSFGLAVAMAITPSRLVTSGYFRVHLYVVMGLNVLATLVALRAPDQFSLWIPLAATLISYTGSVFWLYERPRPGKLALVLVAGLTLAAAWIATTVPPASLGAAALLHWLDPLAGGLVLGSTMAAMLLGHWYLNTPTMALGPLRRLILLMAAALALRIVLAAIGLGLEHAWFDGVSPGQVWFVVLRWLSGLVGTLITAGMAWKTLEIPNTQSATGILYVGVITVLLGELTSQLLSVETHFPL